MQFLILGNEQDEHAAHIAPLLQTRGHRCAFLDSSRFPRELQIAYDPVTGRGSFHGLDGESIEFAEIDAIYWRSYTPPITELPDAEQSYIAANDARGLFESLLKNLPARWINGWEAFQLHQTKPAALAKVAALGVPVPATCIANDAEAIRRFFAAHSEVIFKPVQGGAHTQILYELTEEQLATLAVAPVTLQERIVGTDIRAFVAGDRIAACEIQTDAVDFRDDPLPRFAAVDLPSDVADQCRQAAAALHLKWTGIDLRRTADGRYVFLEANPSPMFLGFECYAELPLSEMLMGLLTAESD